VGSLDPAVGLPDPAVGLLDPAVGLPDPAVGLPDPASHSRKAGQLIWFVCCQLTDAVWHPGLTKKLSEDIECVQKCCLKLLFPALSYTESLHKSGLERLDDRRDMITQNFFRQIKNPKHPLLKCHNQMVLRPTYPYQIPLAKPLCHGRDFVPYCIAKKF